MVKVATLVLLPFMMAALESSVGAHQMELGVTDCNQILKNPAGYTSQDFRDCLILTKGGRFKKSSSIRTVECIRKGNKLEDCAQQNRGRFKKDSSSESGFDYSRTEDAVNSEPNFFIKQIYPRLAPRYDSDPYYPRNSNNY